MSDTPISPPELKYIYAFIDESARNEEYYFMSAITGERAVLDKLNAALVEVVAKHKESIPHMREGFEIHASAIMNGHKQWRNVPFSLRVAIIRDTCIAIGDSDAYLFIEGVDITKQKAKGYRHVYPAREVAFQWLLEKLDYHAKPRDAYVSVYADNHHTAPESASRIAEYRIWGTIGYRSSTLTRICHPVSFIDSKSSLHLQAADVATYIFNRLITIKEKNEKAEALKRELWQYIENGKTRTHIWP